MMNNIRMSILTAMVFIVVAVLVGVHYNERKSFQEEINMISSEREYLLMALKKRSADDCIVEPAPYGWKCTDFKGRVYKITRNENLMKKIAHSKLLSKANVEIAR
jgi:hypothetical protein